ncbi:probable phosphoglycerate mutase [Shouchella lonarensis]|uniref:Probable phosphoglycerate mutase n=1 Tax=Shouchella lonarensis TaxID=1464122 RepID=A0A1G6NFL1_9BACI|nr:histidine phosphatase family protein [Shouchella lonarensis]SDC66623.1 probable phosphoglycerate mutase [Shouchella lonarensis]
MIYVIRHGQTDLNKEGRMQGRQGLPLNETGIEQAESLRDQLKHITFDSVYASPQERAIQTAEIATGTSAVIDG